MGIAWCSGGLWRRRRMPLGRSPRFSVRKNVCADRMLHVADRGRSRDERRSREAKPKGSFLGFFLCRSPTFTPHCHSSSIIFGPCGHTTHRSALACNGLASSALRAYPVASASTFHLSRPSR